MVVDALHVGEHVCLHAGFVRMAELVRDEPSPKCRNGQASPWLPVAPECHGQPKCLRRRSHECAMTSLPPPLNLACDFGELPNSQALRTTNDRRILISRWAAPRTCVPQHGFTGYVYDDAHAVWEGHEDKRCLRCLANEAIRQLRGGTKCSAKSRAIGRKLFRWREI